jgi:hypothetical protein
MVRWVALLAVLSVGALFFRQHAEHVREANAGTLPTRADMAGLPPELRSILGSTPDAGTILRSSGALPGLGIIKKLTGHGDKAPTAGAVPFADIGTPRQIRTVQADVRRDLAALNRLSDDDGASPATAARTLRDVYSSPVLVALGAGGRRAFAERVAGRTQIAQRIRVLGFDGIFVSHRRALAQVVYRLSVREPSGRYIARAPQTWTVTLAREAGRWRFVQGFEAR